MCPRFQFVPCDGRVSWRARRALLGMLGAMILISPMAARAQNAAPGTIGRVEGRDISCENGMSLKGSTSTIGPVLDVQNGTVVTVHSGQARMTLFAGGEVDICGPAKLTVLLAGESFTLALNFGRVRVSLPASTDLRIFTPTIVGTPLGISGGARDVTVGLSLDDSLCVLATSGAIQLEHQFTGESVIVPEAGEFFLNAGKLLPVAGTPGSCHCASGEGSPGAAPRPASPEYAMNVAPPVGPATAADPPAKAAAAAPAPEPAARPNIEVSMLAHANDAHPVTPPAAKDPAPGPPPAPTTAPVYTGVLPPLTYIAGSPSRPPDPSADMVLLVREAHVDPDWEFTGHVAPPDFAQAMQHALGEKPAAAPAPAAASTADQPAAPPRKSKGGFWASLRHIFGGG
jgi:hypothetical protein